MWKSEKCYYFLLYRKNKVNLKNIVRKISTIQIQYVDNKLPQILMAFSGLTSSWKYDTP